MYRDLSGSASTCPCFPPKNHLRSRPPRQTLCLRRLSISHIATYLVPPLSVPASLPRTVCGAGLHDKSSASTPTLSPTPTTLRHPLHPHPALPEMLTTVLHFRLSSRITAHIIAKIGARAKPASTTIPVLALESQVFWYTTLLHSSHTMYLLWPFVTK
jgi:hypothetical protein